jgi:predicted enzyme related to lactoylglutathione lyase
MGHHRHNGVVHMELHTHDLAEVRVFLWQLLGWRSWPVGVGGRDYLALEVSDQLGGGIVACGQRPPSWLPYVEVGDVQRATERASELGAAVLLAPREGPEGWRSVVTTPAAGDLAFWQPKPLRPRRHP